MYGRYYTFPRVGKENRNTVGCPDSYRNAWKIRYKSIVALEFLSGCFRPVYDSDPRPMYLMALDDWIREDGIPSGGKSFYTRA